MKRTLLLLLSAAVLASCGGPQDQTSQSSIESENDVSATSDATSSSEDDAISCTIISCGISEETSSSEAEPEHDPITLTSDHFPEPISGGYPADQQITVAGESFFVSSAMQGGGDYEGTIQMRNAAKGSGTIYNVNSLGVKQIVVVEKAIKSAYFTNTSVLSCFVGASAGAMTTEITASRADTEITYNLTFDLPENNEYFALINNDANAVYVLSITLNF